MSEAYTRPVVDNSTKPASITEQVKTLLRATAPRWWSPYALQNAVVARSVPRRLREIIEADRDVNGRLDQYDEKWIENVAEGRHKVYRWVGSADSPTLF